MRKTTTLILTFALFGVLASQLRAGEVCMMENTACSMPGTAFCLAEKCEKNPTFFLSEDAKKDLGLTDEQVTKIRELVKETVEAIKKDTTNMKMPAKDASMEECMAHQKEMGKVCEKHYPECMSKLEKILDKEQLEKMRTRVFQYYGFVPCPIVLSVLQLNEEQKKEIGKICEETCKKIHQDMMDKTGTTEQKHEKMLQCRLECSIQIKKVLTKEQLEKGEKLISQTPSYVTKMKVEHQKTRIAAQQQSETKR